MEIESYRDTSILVKSRRTAEESQTSMNTHPHTEDQATCTYYFPKHLLVTCKDTLYS